MKSVNLYSTNISEGRLVWCLTSAGVKHQHIKLHLIYLFIYFLKLLLSMSCLVWVSTGGKLSLH